MNRSTIRRGLAPAIALAALATASPAHAQVGGLTGALPQPGDLTGGLPLPGDLTGVLPGELPGGDLPGDLAGGLPLPGDATGGTGTGAAPGGGSGAPAGSAGDQLDASAPVIAGPSRAATVRVDSRGRFRLTGVSVTCPAACSVSVKVDAAGGGTQFVRRTYGVRAGGTLQLKKLKVSKKGLRALRTRGVARVVATVKAGSVGRGIGLKLKPARP
ncbi:MAG TPA: hypothetical protein VF712_16230 [Thermoleophilaceae bacterium]